MHYEDFTVGMKFRSRDLHVTQEAVITFAREFDPQPFHTDPGAAMKSFFGAHVASGWHTCALTMRLFTESVPAKDGIVGGGVDELRWPNVLKPGDTIHLESEVLEMRTLKSRSDVGLVKVRVVTLNQDGKVVQSMMPSLFVPRRG
ncbi:MAG: MaoC family dehydratase [Usitatibacter sp.]